MAFTGPLSPTSLLLQKEYETVIQLSREDHAGTISTQKALEIAEQTLTEYGENLSSDSSLKIFASKILQLEPDQIGFRIPNDAGYSGDQVYYVIDTKTNHFLAVFKVFKDNFKNFLPEIFSLQFLSDAKISDVFSPKINALGRYRLKENNHFLVCESVAPGDSLISHYKNSLQFDVLERGIRKCGQTLAKLHQHLSGVRQGIPDDLEKKTREDLAKAIENLTLFPQPGVNTKKLQELFESTLQTINSDNFPTAVIHGGAKFENIFFDPETDTVTLIDLPTLSDSVDFSGNPVGIPAQDFYKFITDIEGRQVTHFLDEQSHVDTKKHLSDEKVSILLNVFSTGYVDGGGELPTARQLDFFTLASHAFFIGETKVLNPNCSASEPLKSSKKYRIAKILEDLELRLKTL